jgi:hypothetical protein
MVALHALCLPASLLHQACMRAACQSVLRWQRRAAHQHPGCRLHLALLVKHLELHQPRLHAVAAILAQELAGLVGCQLQLDAIVACSTSMQGVL